MFDDMGDMIMKFGALVLVGGVAVGAAVVGLLWVVL